MGQRLGGEAGGRAQQSALCDSDAALTPVAPPTSLKCRLRFVAHVGLLTLLQMVGGAPYFFLETWADCFVVSCLYDFGPVSWPFCFLAHEVKTRVH